MNDLYSSLHQLVLQALHLLLHFLLLTISYAHLSANILWGVVPQTNLTKCSFSDHGHKIYSQFHIQNTRFFFFFFCFKLFARIGHSSKHVTESLAAVNRSNNLLVGLLSLVLSNSSPNTEDLLVSVLLLLDLLPRSLALLVQTNLIKINSQPVKSLENFISNI